MRLTAVDPHLSKRGAVALSGRDQLPQSEWIDLALCGVGAGRPENLASAHVEVLVVDEEDQAGPHDRATLPRGTDMNPRRVIPAIRGLATAKAGSIGLQYTRAFDGRV